VSLSKKIGGFRGGLSEELRVAREATEETTNLSLSWNILMAIRDF